MLLCSSAPLPGHGGEGAQSLIDVGSRKQLLFDELFLDESKGVTLRMNTPFQDAEPVLVADRPWEQRVCAYNTVMLENGKFRMWYDVINMDSEGKQSSRLLCYAESKDGVHWEKPEDFWGKLGFKGEGKRKSLRISEAPWL